jgi:hypothetical protein
VIERERERERGVDHLPTQLVLCTTRTRCSSSKAAASSSHRPTANWNRADRLKSTGCDAITSYGKKTKAFEARHAKEHALFVLSLSLSTLLSEMKKVQSDHICRQFGRNTRLERQAEHSFSSA